MNKSIVQSVGAVSVFLVFVYDIRTSYINDLHLIDNIMMKTLNFLPYLADSAGMWKNDDEPRGFSHSRA